MWRRRFNSAGAGGGRLWPVAAIGLLVVLVPTACMLWFLNAALGNASLAARQRLTEVYRQNVEEARGALAAHWARQLAALRGPPLPATAASAPVVTPARRFRDLVASCDFDSVVLRAGPGGGGYPASTAESAESADGRPDPEPAEWEAAAAMEFADANASAAAAAYERLARSASSPSLRARALLAQARCLAKAGRKDPALAILAGPLTAADLAAAPDAAGRLIAPDAALRALELIGDRTSPAFRSIAERLRARLDDYGEPAIPAGQRLFLMQELQRLAGGPPLPTRAAEHWAAVYLAAPRPAPQAGLWSRAGPDDLWHIASPDGRAVAICRQERLIRGSEQVCSLGARLAGIAIRLCPPGDLGGPSGSLLALPAAEPLTGWELRAELLGGDPFSAAAARQRDLYLWAAVLGVAGVVAAAAAVTGYVGRQVRLARLKNDLIATVSHELKTPLASMRVLIDTLLEGRCRDQGQAADYYALIARENERLSQLIDSFLTFSRMERNKVAFEFRPVEVGPAVAAAVETVRGRFSGEGCRLEVDVPEGLPPVRADRDALITILLNLLDNAWKYTGSAKHVTLRARAEGPWVSLAISDNGVGLSRRAARRVFDRFYQVDQRLSRTAGGCGLGLSIVRFIVEAHGGSVEVASRLGEGSTFTVNLPAATSTSDAAPS